MTPEDSVLATDSRRMTYELAKQLKDAGFPQTGKLGMMLSKNGWHKQPKEKWSSYSAYAPTLSEHIEALGKDFDLLRAPFGTPEDNVFDLQWRAFSNRPDLTPQIATTLKVQAAGDTPEDGTARLWIALNKKN